MTDIDIAAANRDAFLQAFGRFAAGDHDVLREILREDFVEHSPGNPSGRDAFVEYIKTSPIATARLDLKRVIADAEYVVAHYHLVESEDTRGEAVVDIWRFENGRIVEHWDVVQPVPADSETPNGMF
jgi:predicted SnoaL-like aldol condensation-catalyzing enzyme